jgi:hypothetical protein
VVPGVYDAKQNGVTLANGTQIAGGALGISANVHAAKGLVKARPAPTTPTTIAVVAGRANEARSFTAWMKKAYSGYDPKKAPAILMPNVNHIGTYGVYRRWRAEMTKKMDGVFDWRKISGPTPPAPLPA